ncbi:MAG: hydrogenase maturation protease [Chromatiales bacterium]|jgi:hydrogenase maturation protease
MRNNPVLVIGYGNPSRGDDALGPLLLEGLEALRTRDRDLDCFDTLTDFQLQVEHAMDMHGYRQVIFVDAAVNLDRPFRFELLHAARDDSYTSHALNPAAVLAVYEGFYEIPAPESSLLSIRGERFDLGEDLSETARQSLDEAIGFLAAHLMQSISPV